MLNQSLFETTIIGEGPVQLVDGTLGDVGGGMGHEGTRSAAVLATEEEG